MKPVAPKPLHPVMRQRARMVKQAHAQLAQAVPGFNQLPKHQRMTAVQRHVNLRQRKVTR